MQCQLQYYINVKSTRGMKKIYYKYKKKLACNFIRRFLVFNTLLDHSTCLTGAVTAVAAAQLTPLPQLVLKNQFSWAGRFNVL